jgi:branched-chain amino acid transport system substrate-binding protein
VIHAGAKHGSVDLEEEVMPSIRSLWGARQFGLGILLVLATACASGAPPSTGQGTGAPQAGSTTQAASSTQGAIKIGAILELTGPGSFYGTSARQVIQMLLAKVNNQAGGKPIQVVFEDDATDPATAVTKARSLIEQEKVDVLFGPIFSDAQAALAPYVASKRIMEIAPYGAPFDLSNHKNWIVYPGTLDTNCAGLGPWLYDQGNRTMTTLGADYIAGHQLVGFVGQEFKAKGGQVVQQQWAPLGTSDFAPYMSNLTKSDVFVEWTIMPDQLALMKAHRALGVSTPLVHCGTESVEPQHLAELGPQIVGLRGMMNAYFADLQNAPNAEFKAAMKQTYNRVPTSADGVAYMSFNILLAGLEKTRGDARLDVLRPAILGLSLDTPMGIVKFTQNGFAITNKYIVEVLNNAGTIQFNPQPLHTVTDVVDPLDKQ